MQINVTLKDIYMRDAFIEGLKKIGYSDTEITIHRNSVNVVFDVPHSPQPYTRSKATHSIIQKKNRYLCEQYMKVTKGSISMQEKFKIVQEKAPELFGHISGLGRPKQLYSVYEKIGRNKDV